mgnify:CR=1 FL=1
MSEEKTRKFERQMSADEFLELNTEHKPMSYADMADVVIDCAAIPELVKMLPWLQYVAVGVLKHIANDEFSKVGEMQAFNSDPVIRCMLDTMVQRAGGLVSWDTGDAGWGQLYAIQSGEKTEPCAGGTGYILSYYQYKLDEARQSMENLDESLYDDEYDGGPGCLDTGPCYIEEVSDDKRN